MSAYEWAAGTFAARAEVISKLAKDLDPEAKKNFIAVAEGYKRRAESLLKAAPQEAPKRLSR